MTGSKDPNRRVRFADHPSPVSTSSTLSSPGPDTPQQLYHPLVYIQQHSSSPSPPISPNLLALAMLARDIHPDLSAPTFDFDVSLDPALNPQLRNHARLNQILTEPATNPAVPSLTLVSSQLPWEITIQCSKAYPYVTVSDVLGGLYRALRLPASEEELRRERPEKQTAISRAFCDRFDRQVVNRQIRGGDPRQEHVRRIDFLAGVYRFRGLFKTERPGVWNVKFKH